MQRRAPERSDGGGQRHQIVELNGLRGVALLLVVLFHLFGDGRVSGGVDVFLVVSGFLATRALLGRAQHGRIDLAERYGRYAVRLMPPALVVLTAVAIAAVTILPPSHAAQTGREVVASALFVENWALIASQLTYDAAGPATSPVQHFWSLAVQGQFLLLWPVTVAALAMAVRRRPVPLDLAVGLVVGALTAVSFGWAAWFVTVDQATAYFHTGARFWEIGVGVLLAVAVARVTVPGWLRGALGWTGLALVLLSGFVVDGAARYPGPWALVPVSGAVLVMLGSGRTTGWGPTALLASPPLRAVAAISYTLFLWHWPVLIAYLAMRDQPAVGWRGAVVVLGLSIVLAWLTNRLVELRWQARVHRPALAAVVASESASCVSASACRASPSRPSIIRGPPRWVPTTQVRTAGTRPRGRLPRSPPTTLHPAAPTAARWTPARRSPRCVSARCTCQRLRGSESCCSVPRTWSSTSRPSRSSAGTRDGRC